MCNTDVRDLYSVYLCCLWLCVGNMFMFWGAVYLCKNGFLAEVQMWAGKHHLICGPQVSGPFFRESPGSVLKRKILKAPSRQIQNLQGKGLGIWILDNYGAKLCLRT